MTNPPELPSIQDLLFQVQSLDFPQYSYGLCYAASLAARLELPRVSVIELGVAGGNGLVEMERIAHALFSKVQVGLDITGFDLGSGMPLPADYRDMPYIWQPGFFKMDEQRLRERMQTSQLILGDVGSTGIEFMKNLQAPLGFISFDLDYYSSTKVALDAVLRSPAEAYLPRTLCYFDDTVGPHEELHSEFTGEMLAIKEFNLQNENRKLAKVNGLRYKPVPIMNEWVEGIYVLHLFDHPMYNQYVFGVQDRQFPLQELP